MNKTQYLIFQQGDQEKSMTIENKGNIKKAFYKEGWIPATECLANLCINKSLGSLDDWGFFKNKTGFIYTVFSTGKKLAMREYTGPMDQPNGRLL